jgi:ferredoxin-NADP reductase
MHLPLADDARSIGEDMRDNIHAADIRAASRSILFAGETGAASILDIAKRLASAGHRFELHNFAQSADRTMLQEEIDALRHHGKVHQYFDLSHDQFAQTSAHAMSPAHAHTHIYCSGPRAFMDLIERQAREWVYPVNVHRISVAA